MTTATTSGVRCGNHTTPTRHASVDEVRACFRNRQHSAYLDRAAGERFAADLDLSSFDAAIQEREAQEDRDVAEYKMNRDMQLLGEIVEHRPSRLPVTEDGMYRNPITGQIFKVYVTVHGAHQRVAKELVLLAEENWYPKTVRGKEVTVKAEFTYRGKAGLQGLTADMKMSLEEGMKYGAVYGVCVRCAATLTREESIERAMGPVCAGKANWA